MSHPASAELTANALAKAYDEMLDRLEDGELNALADARAGEKVVRVSLDEL